MQRTKPNNIFLSSQMNGSVNGRHHPDNDEDGDELTVDDLPERLAVPPAAAATGVSGTPGKQNTVSPAWGAAWRVLWLGLAGVLGAVLATRWRS